MNCAEAREAMLVADVAELTRSERRRSPRTSWRAPTVAPRTPCIARSHARFALAERRDARRRRSVFMMAAELPIAAAVVVRDRPCASTRDGPARVSRTGDASRRSARVGRRRARSAGDGTQDGRSHGHGHLADTRSRTMRLVLGSFVAVVLASRTRRRRNNRHNRRRKAVCRARRLRRQNGAAASSVVGGGGEAVLAVLADPGGGVYDVSRVRAITIRETPKIYADMMAVLAQYDREPANVTLNFQLIAAENTDTRDPRWRGWTRCCAACSSSPVIVCWAPRSQRRARAAWPRRHSPPSPKC